MPECGLLARKIHAYVPLEPGIKPIAMIHGLNFVFRADTPMKAVKAAEEWRQVEYAKLTGKKPEAGASE